MRSVVRIVLICSRRSSIFLMPVGLEVREQAVDRLQQVRRLRVHALARHHFELLDGGHEHLQPLERGDRLREVALRVVERLDVAADFVHHLLRRLRLRLDVAHLDHELPNGLLAALEVAPRRGARRGLLAHGLQHLLVEHLHLILQLQHLGLHLAERLLGREEPIDVRCRVKVGRVEWVGRGQHVFDGRLELCRETHRR